jgi:hypothetical protein
MSRFKTLVVVLGLFFSTTVISAEEKKADTKEIKPLMVMKGRKSKTEEASCQQITNAKDWRKLWVKHRTGSDDLDRLPSDFEFVELDFEQVMVVAVFNGANDNFYFCGLDVDSIQKRAEKLIVRIEKKDAGQTVGFPRTPMSLEEAQSLINTDWLFVVIPRSAAELVVEVDRTKWRDAPHEWKELKRFPALSK